MAKKNKQISVFETIEDIKQNLLILGFVSVLILVAIAALNYSPMHAEIGDLVSVKYELYIDNGLVQTQTTNFTLGQEGVIEGFTKGVLGMRIGENTKITVPPENGYGVYDPFKIELMPEFSKVWIIGSAYKDALESVLTKGEITIGSEIMIKSLPWPLKIRDIETIIVEEKNILDVTYDNVPVLNSLYYDPLSMPWQIKVTEIDDDFITYQNLPKIGVPVVKDAYTVGRVTKIEDGAIVVDYNHELAGKTLVFELELLELVKASQ